MSYSSFLLEFICRPEAKNVTFLTVQPAGDAANGSAPADPAAEGGLAVRGAGLAGLAVRLLPRPLPRPIHH